MATTTSNKLFALVDLLQQRCKRIQVVFAAGRHRPGRKRPAKRGGDSSLVRRIVNADQLPIPMKFGGGILVEFK